jgi:hypothetical protein
VIRNALSKQVDSTDYTQGVTSICQQKNYDIILLDYELEDNQKKWSTTTGGVKS